MGVIYHEALDIDRYFIESISFIGFDRDGHGLILLGLIGFHTVNGNYHVTIFAFFCDRIGPNTIDHNDNVGFRHYESVFYAFRYRRCHDLDFFRQRSVTPTATAKDESVVLPQINLNQRAVLIYLEIPLIRTAGYNNKERTG